MTKKLPEHGTRSRYYKGCRCESCVQVYREMRRAAKAKRIEKGPPAHGTPNAYSNYGCRCEECLAAWREGTYDYIAGYRAANRDELNEKRLDYYHNVEKPRGEAAEAARKARRMKK